MTCPLCLSKNENVIYQNELFRVILIDDIPGYVRVITNKHIKEFSDLSDEEAVSLMLAVKKIEKAILKTLNPDKVNIAMLGNMVPHLHIHIIPRYKNDPWWPNATFCEKVRDFDYPSFDSEKLIQEIKKIES
jgi:diadenosine tetraphosphate (Ap4A) HIT family hydrolase